MENLRYEDIDPTEREKLRANYDNNIRLLEPHKESNS